MNSFVYSTPESQGLESKAIQKFVAELKENEIDMHSFVLIRNNNIIAEGYYKPLKKDTLHRMFSITKSFVSLAIGFLADKNVISLDDKISKYFNDKFSEGKLHPYIEELTIRNMLKMATPYTKTTYDENKDLDFTKTFFNTKPSHKSGTVFNYDTSSSHTLAALVEKLTGKKLLDFLRECFLDEIGFSKEAYIISDPIGVSMGGSGLVATTEDLVKVALVIMNKGYYNGKQLIPKWYLDEATSFKISTYLFGGVLEEKQGYGYQFWRIRNNGFMCYGLGGQLMVFLPDKNVTLVTTAYTHNLKEGIQKLFDIFWNEIYNKFNDEPLMEDEKALNELKEALSNLQALSLKNQYNNENLSIKNKYIFEENSVEFDFIQVDINDKDGAIKYKKLDKINTINFALGYNKEGEFNGQRYIASGSWQDKNSILICCKIIDYEIFNLYFTLVFEEDKIHIFTKQIGGKKGLNYNGCAKGNLEK